MPALNVGELVGLIRADDSGMRRGLNDAELRMRGFQRDTEGRLRHLDGRFATVGEQIAAGLREGTDEGRRFGLSLGSLAGMAGKLGGLAGSIGGIAAKLGAAVPLAAGLAAAVGNIAPAAGVAATGMFAVVLASNALKLGMVGVGDAVTAALDPSKAEEFNEALKKLSPSAQAFAKQVKALAPEFKKLQQDVQERLFKGLDGVLKDMGTHTLPVLRNGLTNAAGALNLMGKNVGNTAVGLSKSGALGQAISGANTGLYNLSRIPAQIVQGLTQVAAAAAPAFGKLTAAAGGAFGKLSDKLTAAFESHAMQDAIERAIDLIGQLAEVAGNVGSIIGSVFGAAQVSGGGFIGVLQEITGALADAFASPQVQGGLKAIFGVMSSIAQAAGPILVSLLKTLGQVFEKLGPPVEQLVKHLGDGLLKVADALGPVLVQVADVVGKLVEAALPFVDLAADLAAQVLPILTPLFAALGDTVEAATPFLAQLAQSAGQLLMPILQTLATQVLPKILPPFISLSEKIFPLLTDAVVKLSPSLVKIGEAFGELLVAAAPLIEELAKLAVQILDELSPYIGPLIDLIAELAAIFADELAAVIRDVVIPALQLIVALLQGDFDKAWQAAKDLVRGAIGTIVRWISEIPGKTWRALSDFGGKLRARADEAGRQLREAISRKVSEAVGKVRELPGKARAALGDLGSRLYSSGQALVRGFINGIKAMGQQVANAASSLVSKARAYFPFSPAKEGPFSGKGWTLYSGQSLAQGFADGISARAGLVQTAIGDMVRGAQVPLGGLDMSLTGPGLPGIGMGPQAGAYAGAGTAPQRVVIELSGPREMRELIRGIVQRDGRGDVQLAFGQ